MHMPEVDVADTLPVPLAPLATASENKPGITGDALKRASRMETLDEDRDTKRAKGSNMKECSPKAANNETKLSRRAGGGTARDRRVVNATSKAVGVSTKNDKNMSRQRVSESELPEGFQADCQPTAAQVSAHIHMLKNTGNAYFLDKDDGTVPFALKVVPFSEMPQETKNKLQFIAHFFARVRRCSNVVASNASQAKAKALDPTSTVGKMYAVGWRKAMVPGEKYGIYTPKSVTSDDTEAQDDYIQLYEDLGRVSAIYKELFEEVAPAQLLENKKIFEQTEHLPSLSQVEPGMESRTTGFFPASNLTITEGDFNNVLHRDNDASPYTFGLWLNTRKDGTLIDDAKEIEAAIKGGEFIIPEYRTGVDFLQPAMYLLIWRGKQDLHATVKSTTTPGVDFVRWGSSVQVNARLLKAAETATEVSSITGLAAHMEKWQFYEP